MRISCNFARDWHAKLLASAGENTCNLQAKTIESQLQKPAQRRQKLNTQQKIPAQLQAKKHLQFHTELPAIPGNLLSHRG